MKKLLLILLILQGLVVVGFSQTCKYKTIEKLSDSLIETYLNRQLGRLDTSHPFLINFRINYSHSIAEGKDFVKSFKSFALAEKWLRSREYKGSDIPLPNRQVFQNIKCKKGTCEAESQGLLHNQLYLTSFTYGYRKNGCPYIKKIDLLDGD